MTVYNGRDPSAIVAGLRRNSAYLFRVRFLWLACLFFLATVYLQFISFFLECLCCADGRLLMKLHGCRRLTENFCFQLSARNDDGDSGWSEPVTFETVPERPAAPSKPYPKGRVLPTSMKVAWDYPKDCGGSDVQSFHLESCTAGPPPTDWQVIYEGKDRDHQVTGLTPGATYQFRVACTTTGGRSGPSESLKVATVPVIPSAPRRLSLQSKPKPHSLHVKWLPPETDGGSEVTEFEVEMTSPDGSIQTVSTGQRMDSVFAGLTNGRAYTFRVRGHNRAGAGHWCEPLEARTGAGPPDVPAALRAVAKSPHVVALSWDPPPNDNGSPITEYRVQQAVKR